MKKLIGTGIILKAARHNERAIQAELGAGGSIDAARSGLNYRLAGPATPKAVSDLARSRMAVAGVTKLRKDAVQAIEIVFSLPVGTGIDERSYFSDCMGWAAGRFGGFENILAADVHLDEAAPHCHVLLLPLISSRMVGSDLMGGPQMLKGHLKNFHEAVAARHGLRKPPARLVGATKTDAVAAVVRRLRQLDDPALHSCGWAIIRASIENDPAAWLLDLGIAAKDRPAKRMRSSISILTSPGKGPKREPAALNPIGFAANPADRTLCSVGFGDNERSIHHPDLASATRVTASAASTTAAMNDDLQAGEPGAVRTAASDCVDGVGAAVAPRDAASTVRPDHTTDPMLVAGEHGHTLGSHSSPSGTAAVESLVANLVVANLVSTETSPAAHPMQQTDLGRGIGASADRLGVGAGSPAPVDRAEVSSRVSTKPGLATFRSDTRGEGRSRPIDAPQEARSGAATEQQVDVASSAAGTTEGLVVVGNSLDPLHASACERSIGAAKVRESDRSAALWSEELGEFIDAPPPPSRRSKAAARAWVAERLAAKPLGARP